MSRLKESIRKWVLKNAIDHDGKAVVGAIIPKLIGENKELKNKVKELVPLIKEEVEKVNKMSMDDQIKELKDLAPELLEKKEQQLLPDLPHGKEVRMAFLPEPSKHLHIGHAKACIMNYYYARKYNGKFFIRFEDSNPEKAKLEFYDSILEDLKWLGVDWDEVHYISDYFDVMLEDIKGLIERDKAYVCTCDVETIREGRRLKKACPCRSNTKEENLKRYERMLEGKYSEGEAIVRLKIDMAHKNAAMRDPAIARIILTPHPRTGSKYKVYPLYDFATAYMNGIEKLTHRIRSKEFELKKELQDYIHDLFGIKKPFIFEIGRFNLEGKIASGRQIRELVESGEVSSWDDPRLTTLKAYKRRGFQPQAIFNFILQTGLSKAEAHVSEDVLAAENRKIIDPIAKRYFFVHDPVTLELTNIPENYEVEVPLHPDKNLGVKTYAIKNGDKVLIERRDYINGKTVRLKDLMNIEIKGKTGKYIGNEIVKDMSKIHWVLDSKKVKVVVVMPDASELEGYAEEYVLDLKVDDVIQFERFGFVRVDDMGEVIRFYFAHK